MTTISFSSGSPIQYGPTRAEASSLRNESPVLRQNVAAPRRSLSLSEKIHALMIRKIFLPAREKREVDVLIDKNQSDGIITDLIQRKLISCLPPNTSLIGGINETLLEVLINQVLLGGEKYFSDPALRNIKKEYLAHLENNPIYTGERDLEMDHFQNYLENLHADPSLKANSTILKRILKNEMLKLNPVETTFLTEDGLTLEGFQCVHRNSPAEVDQQKWIIFFGGNNESAQGKLRQAYQLANAVGCNFLVFNYRGVGGSEGIENPIVTQQDLVNDGQAALDFLLQRRVDPKNIILHGYSQGGAVAAQVVAARDINVNLVLDRTYTSFHAAASAQIKRFVGWQWLADKIATWVSRHWEFNTVAALNTSRPRGNITIIEHESDEVILPAARFAKLCSPNNTLPRGDRLRKAKKQIFTLRNAEKYREVEGHVSSPDHWNKDHLITYLDIFRESLGLR
jgi:pimeloyl-ACP methyl ester carboxylesterase